MGYEECTEKRTYTVPEIQDILGLCESSVYKLLKENKFRTVKIGRYYRVSKRSFEKWLEEAWNNEV